MERSISLFIIACMLLTGCTTYTYFTPPVNAPVFEEANEVHLSGNASITGYSGKVAYSISDNLAVTGMFHRGVANENLGFTVENEKYRSIEGELAIGLYNGKTNGGSAYGGVFLGYGTGYSSDVWTLNDSLNPFEYTRFEGNFQRPFIQLSFGANGDGENLRLLGQSMKGSVHTSNNFSIRMNYFHYSGDRYTPDSLNVITRQELSLGNFFFEPYYTGTIGGKYLRVEFGIGCPLNFSVLQTDGKETNRIFPLHAHIGLCAILGRKYN